MAAYESISPDELNARLGEVALFDVRGPAETERGIIEGATLVPLHLVPMNVDRFRGDRDVVVYCTVVPVRRKPASSSPVRVSIACSISRAA